MFDLDSPSVSTIQPVSESCGTDDRIYHGPFDLAETKLLDKHASSAYGTTMRGLMTEYDMEPDEFLHFVHEIDLSDVVPDPELDSLLAHLGGRKHIYTGWNCPPCNAHSGHLWHPGHFDFIFDVVASICIPNRTRNICSFC